MTSTFIRRTQNTNDVLPLDDHVDAVLLQDGSLALVDRIDRLALIASGHDGRWLINKGGTGLPYVRIQGPHGLASVPRLILGTRPNEAIAYKNGNRLDLRRTNLEIRLRRGGRRKSIVATAIELHPLNKEAQARYLKGAARKEGK